MGFSRFRKGLHPVISTKNVVEASGIMAAGTNTILDNIIGTSEAPTLATTNSVARGASVNGVFLSIFFYTEGGEVANEVPLVDWYIIKNPGNNFTTVFDATNLPTPGATGSHDNKRYIFHTEKGLSGGGDASLTGVPMVFKGVIVLPRGFRKMNANDVIQICARANFATKFCIQAIYKWYH